MNVAQKLIASHLVTGDLTPGSEISIRIDQTLTQDSTGTMAYLQLEAMGVDKVRTKRSVAYIDHNMLQSGSENADDHKYIQTVAAKHGIWFSRPGNGICHQVHLERFSVPGQTLLGSDSHTPTCGAASPTPSACMSVSRMSSSRVWSLSSKLVTSRQCLWSSFSSLVNMFLRAIHILLIRGIRVRVDGHAPKLFI